MLLLKPNCECCDVDLPPAAEAQICTFECTFCRPCAEQLAGICPNCSGNLVLRPVRPAGALERFPAATERYIREKPCHGVKPPGNPNVS